MITPRHAAPHAPTAHRLFSADGPTLTQHQRRFGALPEPDGQTLMTSLEQAGLTGRGGAGFSAARKIASITGNKSVVIGNGAEGEPLSHKDAVLLARAPHLILDGLCLAADAVGADKVFIYVPSRAVPTVKDALDERHTAGWVRRPVTVVEAPDTFVAGEESAVVRRIEGGPALPRDRTVLTTISGVRGRPTLVNNVETLAHIALIARYGPRWFRSIGDQAEPGTMLVTLSGAMNKPSVAEVPTGTLLTDLIGLNGATNPRALRAVLVGGYHGNWIPAARFTGSRLCRASLTRVGASPGAGVIHALGVHECGLARTADIAAYLADESAGQCGPCLNGLPRLAQLLDELAYSRVDDPLLGEIHRMLDLIDGRGSCRHPDGTARLIRSALDVFATDIAHHCHGRCDALLITARGAAHYDLRRDARLT
ncbi:MAG: NADH:ubiquinone oxidoreductase, NADH-binding (51 kD) subunit [Mycobacterium sp.]|nr:NADH:ubiquinone oxidoreductase, NADH-binding (51 kD) subunit [Mycobacterium sp.]